MRAPIVLFTYNRLKHTKLTVEALKKNLLAKDSELYIYSDGPKTVSDREIIKEIRVYLHSIQGFKKVRIIERTNNVGLAYNIISGITSVVNRYGNIIVLEDDIVTSPYFLKFMNDALRQYKDNNIVCVSGFVDPRIKQLKPFFLRGADCWGWATWKRGWSLFEKNGSVLLDRLKEHRLSEEFDYFGSQRNMDMLQNQVKGKISSWAIRWHASAFLANKLTLYPPISLIRNIGHDGSGINSDVNKELQMQKISDHVLQIRDIPVRISSEAVRAIIGQNRNIWSLLKYKLFH